MLNPVRGQFRLHRRDVLDDLGQLDGEDGDADFEARRLGHASRQAISADPERRRVAGAVDVVWQKCTPNVPLRVPDWYKPLAVHIWLLPAPWPGAKLVPLVPSAPNGADRTFAVVRRALSFQSNWSLTDPGLKKPIFRSPVPGPAASYLTWHSTQYTAPATTLIASAVSWISVVLLLATDWSATFHAAIGAMPASSAAVTRWPAKNAVATI